MNFQLLVLRFMSLVIRAQWLGDFTTDEMVKLHEDIERRIASEHPPFWPVPPRTLPAGIPTKHGQAALDVEEEEASGD
jgi:hypothetical protein